MASSALAFTVRRGEPELVPPAEPTPHELKPLSDIDDQQSLRYYRSGLHFYRHSPARAGQDPAKVIKAALARALVHYYPLAGRLREGPGRKLVVECTGEGVVFVEADSDVRLKDFGDMLLPPFPCYEQLLCEPDSTRAVVVGRPLLFVQVTRLSCGGFVFGIQTCHNMADAAGAMQLFKAIGELARGADVPSVAPVWDRELLTAHSPPRITYAHPEYEQPLDDSPINPYDAQQAYRTFFFGPRELAALRCLAPHAHAFYSRFDLLAAAIWRCRTAALGCAPGDEVRVQFPVNARGRSGRIRTGYYGNGFAYTMAACSAAELLGQPLGHAVRLVAEAKARAAADEFLQSAADLLAARGRPRFVVEPRTYLVSDVTRAGIEEVDFGWGENVYGGPAIVNMAAFHVRCRNRKGEEGIAVLVCLPAPVLERLDVGLTRLLSEEPVVAS